jgi:DNA-binding CsgD family transcriptional regulator
VPGDLPRAAALDAGQVRRALGRLRDLGLVRDTDGAVEPLEPDTAVLRALDAYRADATEQARLEGLTRSLMTVYRPAVAQDTAKVEVEYLTDRRRRNAVLQHLDATALESRASLHAGPMPPGDVLEASLGDDIRTTGRGVLVRALYQRSVTQTPRHARHLARQAAAGVRIRLIDHAPYDILVYDHSVACFPADPDDPAAAMVVVRGSALVKPHIALFEDYWLRGVPYEAGSQTAAQDGPGPGPGKEGGDAGERPGAGESGLTPQERVIVRLMARGLTDDQTARRAGVHRRTVQRAVTKLMERLGAASRFEAGLKLAQDPEFARVMRPGTRGADPAQG